LGLAATGTLVASVPFIVVESAGAATRLDLVELYAQRKPGNILAKYL
jgi:hypothetical protein